MEGIRFNGKLDYIIDDIGYVNVIRNKGFYFPYKNGKCFHGIIFVEKGEINYRFTKSGDSITVKKGSILFIPKKTPYNAEYVQDGTIVKVFNFDIISGSLPDVFDNYFLKESTSYMEICKNINGSKEKSIMYIASIIYELLYVMEKESFVLPPKFKKILPAINEIHNNYNENKKLSFYSDLCFMSGSNFRRLFKEYTGKSFIEYRNLLRISEAKKMIDSGEFTVAEAAHHTGFHNMSFFYEVLNKYIV